MTKPASLLLFLALAVPPAAPSHDSVVLAQGKARRARSAPARVSRAALNRKPALAILQAAVPYLTPHLRYELERFPRFYGGLSNSLRARLEGLACAERLGWVEFVPEEHGTRIRITDAGQEIFSGRYPGMGCDEATGECQLRLGEMQVREVTGIRYVTPTEAEVDYVWVYAPTELMRREARPPRLRRASASFARYDDGWRLTNWGLL